MPLPYHPQPGTIVICDYNTGFTPPEMVKMRPAVIISPRLRRRDRLCTVVPLSQTPPAPAQDYHCQIRLGRPLPRPWGQSEFWVKADMLATVSFERLNLVQIRRRQYIEVTIDPDDLRRIRECVRAALGLD